MLDTSTIYLYIVCLSLVHITGFTIFLGYYLSRKKFRYYIFAAGWLFNLIGTIVFLIPFYGTDINLIRISGIISGVLVTVGIFYIARGLLSHFLTVKRYINTMISIVIVLVPLVVYFFDRRLASDINSFEQILVYAFLLIIGIVYRNKILQYSRVSYGLYIIGTSLSLLISLLIQIPEYQVQEFPVLFHFTMQIWLAIVLILFLIHLEHSILEKEKYILKDRYSHDMAQYIQLAMGNLDLIKETNNPVLFSKLQGNLNDTSELLRQIREI
jgi:hypothetical protein